MYALSYPLSILCTSLGSNTEFDQLSSDEDERTIAKAERINKADVEQEIKALNQEATLDFDEFLSTVIFRLIIYSLILV